jgi:hypothetical protein
MLILEAATIPQQCKVLRLPSAAAQCAQLAEQAARERRRHLGYLEALLRSRVCSMLPISASRSSRS